jgi:hypothetical protein
MMDVTVRIEAGMSIEEYFQVEEEHLAQHIGSGSKGFGLWDQFKNPILLAAVGARGARQLIRRQLTSFGLCEGSDWLGVA